MISNLRAILCAAIAGILLACTGVNGSHSLPVRGAASTAERPPVTYTTKFIQLVIFENTSYGQIIGNPSAPYMNSLAKKWATMTNSHAVTHPSQPNYLALFSGSTQGITGDQCPVGPFTPSLGGELIAAGHGFTGYAESMPNRGFTGCEAMPDNLPSGYLYMRKHVPWTDFSDVPANDSLPYPGPLKLASKTFIWITPNMCNDMHDCSIATGDTWASKNLPQLIAWDTTHHGVLILTFDENDGSPGNQILTILAGNVHPGQYTQNITHNNVLRTIENVLGVPALGNAKTASPITGVVK